MRVIAIAPAGKSDVYNLEVDGTHDFVVENGVIAHNCYDEVRYFLMARYHSEEKKPDREQVVYDPFTRQV